MRGNPLRPGLWLPTVVAVAAVVLLWQWVAAGHPYVLPKPRAVGRQLADDPALYLRNARTTLAEAMSGLAVGFGAGCALAVAMSQSTLVRRALMPLAVVLQVTPIVTIAPALVVAFGFGMTPKVVVTALITFFPALINAHLGLRSVDPGALEVFRTLDASRWQILLRLRLPSSLPHLFAALRLCVPLSVVGAVVAEFAAAGSTAGLGTMITVASANSQLDRAYAAIFCLAVMGVLLTLIVAVAQRRALSWHESERPVA